MECGDLERYLEAFLDGRLSQSRGALLRCHLQACGGCQARVERLRQFERDTQRRFRALDQSSSIWRGLELDLVVSSRSTPTGRLLAMPRVASSTTGGALETGPGVRPRRGRALPMLATAGRGRASRMLGVVLIAMALGSLYQLARSYGQPTDDVEAVASVYMQFRHGADAPALRSHDAEQLRSWLSAELGAGMPMPPLPPGYHLIGADRASLPSGPAGTVLYGTSEESPDPTVVLFVRPAPAGETRPISNDDPVTLTTAQAGLHELAWHANGFNYTAVGQQSLNDLRSFAR